jgi:transcriptional regulator with XRE-family HTH domain
MPSTLANVTMVSTEPVRSPVSIRVTRARSTPERRDSSDRDHPHSSRASLMSCPGSIEPCPPRPCLVSTVARALQTRQAEGMKTLSVQLHQAREKAGLSQSELGRRLGWVDHSNVNRIENGRADRSEIARWAAECDHEVLVVPLGSADSIAARLHEADERERRIASELLDLLAEARAVSPGVLDYFEDDIVRFRRQIAARRALEAS